MDGVNINKYLGQFNPILIVPVLSAVIGAILVFVFGFKQTNGPRFQSGSHTDSLKRSKKKANGTKQSDTAQQTSKVQNVQSSKVNKKAAVDGVAAKKVAVAANEKPVAKKKDDKKTDDKKPESGGSPAKKVTATAKKSTKESPAPTAASDKKQKSNKKLAAEERGKKPADFDDGDWFTVQSKSTKKNVKTDDAGAKSAGNASPTPGASKTKPKGGKVGDKAAEKKSAEPNSAIIEEAPAVVADKDEPKVKVADAAPAVADVVAETVPVAAAAEIVVEEKVVAAKPATIAQPKKIVPEAVAQVEDSAVAFDELGEWTDAKPDRKRGNKKKSRKD